ncbi:hypothetical protein [Roseibacillus persicicus]|uniref:Antitoxin n=1 Tax=Roseibacillus persicicus TaxID=454148 RepID=A0A918WPL0_9BACT|nr:hypothetical protein [Roseibacillus persicicus]MDQ8189314.1 hypothetical protein [Roseibacillus persicicus]GHC65369.1 hypothetical protein GCM10007100_36410 [Roseibacillus persicicus]
MTLEPSYVTNEAGERTAVLLSIENYRSLLEDLSDLAAIADRREEPTVSHEQIVAELRADGLLPN